MCTCRHKDKHNEKAKSLYRQIKEQKAFIYTSDYVLDELYTLLKSRASHNTAIKFMDEIGKNSPVILRVTEEIENNAKDIFRRIEDKKLSFTDCTSFELINQFDINAVFSFDEHFRYYSYSHPVEFIG